MTDTNVTCGPVLASPFDVLHLDCCVSLFTLASCCIFIYWGISRMCQFRTASVPINPRYLRSPLGFKVQTYAQGLMAYLACFELLAVISVIQPKNDCQYMVALLSSLSLMLAWILVYFISQLETTCKISTEPTLLNHHSVLHGFWITRFTIEMVSTLLAFWQQKLSLFSFNSQYMLIHLVLVEGILVLGQNAPGLPIPPYYNSVDGFGQDQDEDEIEKTADKDAGCCNKSSEPEIHSYIQEIMEEAKYDKSGNLIRVEDDEEYIKTNADQLPRVFTRYEFLVTVFQNVFWPENDLNIKMYTSMYLSTLGLQVVLNLWSYVNKKDVVDSLMKTGPEPHIDFEWTSLALGFLLTVANYGVKAIQNNVRGKMGQVSDKKLQIQLFEKAHSLSLRWHLDGTNDLVLTELLGGPMMEVQISMEQAIYQFMGLIDIFMVLVYVTLVYNQQVTILLVLTMIYAIGLDSIFRYIYEQFYTSSNHSQLQTSAYLKMEKAIDSIHWYETVKYFCTEDYELKQFKDALDAFEVTGDYADFIFDEMLNLVQVFLTELGIFGAKMFCLWILVQSSNVGIEMTPGDFVLLTTILGMYSRPLTMLLNVFSEVEGAMQLFEELEAILELEPEVKDVPNAKDLVLKNGEIEFRNVGFYYEPEKQVLDDINFKVPGGKTLAIVGPSGSGKSTIIKLLFRFYDTTDGEILIDGQDISQVKQKSLRQVIGVVPQDCVLLDDTIEWNLRYARIWDATNEDIVKASKEALIHKTIESFPKRYQTMVGQRGQKLSGGEKQRLAIARVLLKQPKIYLLDEATSSLDTLTERKIQKTIKAASENHTTIIVAHRLSTIVHADQIVVLKDGTIVEKGSHKELLSTNGVYAQLWKAQSEVPGH